MFCWHIIFYLLSQATFAGCVNEVRINEDQMGTTKRRSRNEHHKWLAEISQSYATATSNIRIFLSTEYNATESWNHIAGSIL